MLKLLNRSIRDFQAFYPKLLLFEYLYMLLTSIVVIPVISFIFNRILIVIGSGALLNSDVYRLGSTFEGAFGLIVIGLVASFALFIELCVLIILVQQRYVGRKIAIIDAVLTTLQQTPRLFGFGIFQLLVLLLVLIPFIQSPLSTSFYALFNGAIFLQNKVLDVSYMIMIIYCLILIVAIYTVLRSIFVLHFIVLEGKTIVEAVRSSLALTRRRRWQIFLWLFILNGTVLGVGFLFITFISYLPSWLDNNVLRVFTSHYSLTLSTILTYLFTLLLMPVNIIFLTRLFYFFSYEKGIKLPDQLKVAQSKLGRLERSIFIYLKKNVRARWLFVAVTIIYIALIIFVGFKANESLVYAKWNVIISAHRGDMEKAPENSMPAIHAAIEKGIQSVEVDVQLTKDGVAVLHHDHTLQRMTGVPALVSELTYDELSMLAIGFDEDTGPIYIPTLEEALLEGKNKIKFLLDLKPYGPGEELGREIVRLVQNFDMTEDVYIQSFDRSALQQIRSSAPEIKIGQILFFAFGDLSALDVDFYTIEQTMLTKQLVERAHAAGREVWVWTVNNKRNMKEVLKFKIDGLITDYPVLAQSMVELR